MKKVIAVIMMICILLCSCDSKSNSDNKTDTKVLEESTEGYKVTWNSNMLENNDSHSMIERITYLGNDISIGISVMVNQENKGEIEIPMMCFMLINGIPIPFSLDGGEEKEINYLYLTNGIEKTIIADFYPYGIDENDSDIIFIAIPYYQLQKTIELSDNMILYCKKVISSEIGSTEKINMDFASDYFVTNDTVKTYNKELYDISPYNGAIKDFIVQKSDGDVFYLGDYKDSDGKTYLFNNGDFLAAFSGDCCMLWDCNGGRFINSKLDKSRLNKGLNSIFAVTVRSDDVVLARKSLNTLIEIE